MDIDGRAVANLLQEQLKSKIAKSGISPKLVFVLVGDHAPSKTYVRMKEKASEKVGITSEKIELPESVTEKDLLKVIERLNNDSSVDGILVQMPLPKSISETAVIHAIDPKKDVDCFHPINVGKMTMGEKDCFLPCTPYGILKLLEHYKVETAGKHVVVLGRSNIVGRPIANLLSQKGSVGDATVTIAHSRTKNIKDLCQSADVLICAIGKAKFVTKDMVNRKTVVIDVGINRTDEGLVGDVDYENVKGHCAMITPVPGGVGPMTITMLLENTFKSCQDLHLSGRNPT